MIRLQRDRTAIPAKYHGPGLRKLLTKLLAAWFDSGGAVPFNQNKKLQVWKEAKDTLRAESADKCAYCESPTAIVAYGDVEHFRPKDTYWWLAFSYDNYTFSCQLCNQKFKGANFPVAGTAVAPPVVLPGAKPATAQLNALAARLCADPANDNTQSLINYFGPERAHLPHPYLDDPETLLAWQVDDANREISLVPRGGGIAAQRAATAAADFLGLNREELRRHRYLTYQSIHTLCLVLQSTTDTAVRNLVIQDLTRQAGAGSPFAGMTRYFLRQWNVLQ